MTILHSCCFWKSVKKGSYASAIYTMIYFGSSCLITSINIYDEQKFLMGEADKPIGESFLEKESISPTTVIFNFLLLISSSFGIISSILVIIGLKTDQRQFLLPWILVLLIDIFLAFAHFIYLLIIKTLNFEPVTAILFTIDFFILALNIYCLLCVVSQYQVYRSGRGRISQRSNSENEDNKIIKPSKPTKICLNATFKNHQKTNSPLIYGHTNFTVIPEELTQAEQQEEFNINSTKYQPKVQNNLNINTKKKRVKFPEDVKLSKISENKNFIKCETQNKDDKADL